jgi:HD-GYP domain-containing protein (c-di-GMP phosphodiesterase class II)
MSTTRSQPPGNLSEEFYQISPQILASFPKFRPPLTLYFFNEKVKELSPYVYAGERLSKEQQAEVAGLCADGKIFVARSDRPIYAEHISKQLDLVLMDTDLKEGEIAEILGKGVRKSIESFFEQPVKPVLHKLETDLLVLTEYLWGDPYRIKALLRRLSQDADLSARSWDMLLVGLGLYLEIQSEDRHRKVLDRLAVGLATANVGWAKVPNYIREKRRNLSPEEQKQVRQTPLAATRILQKLGYRDKIILQCVEEHRECLDGSGYPRGLRGKDISWFGRMGGAAAAFADLIATGSERGPEQLIDTAEVLAQNEAKFDPKVSRSLRTVLLHAFSGEACKEPPPDPSRPESRGGQ